MTTPLFMLRAVQMGVAISDLDLLTIGLVLDMFTEAQNDRGSHGWFPFLCFLYRVFRMENLVMSALGLGDVEEHRGVFEELGHCHCCGTGDRRVGGQGG